MSALNTGQDTYSEAVEIMRIVYEGTRLLLIFNQVVTAPRFQNIIKMINNCVYSVQVLTH